MVALLGREPRSGADGDLVGALGGHVQDHLVGAVPLSLRPQMADPAPRHGPRAWLRDDVLREGEIPRKQHVEAQAAAIRAKRDTAPGQGQPAMADEAEFVVCDQTISTK